MRYLLPGRHRRGEGERPCSDGFAYKAVIVEGWARLLEDHAEREVALRTIITKHDPAAVDAELDVSALPRTLVYVILIDEFSYKERPSRVPK